MSMISNLAKQYGFDDYEVFTLSSLEDLDNFKPKKKCILDCITYDFPFPLSSFLEVQDKFDWIISSNLVLQGYQNHILYDCKIGQLNFYLENIDFFNKLSERNLKFLRLKNYLFLTNHIRFERLELFDRLVKNSLLDYGLINFPSISKTNQDEVNYSLTDEQKSYYNSYENDSLPMCLDLLPKDSFIEDKKHNLYLNKSWTTIDDYGENYNPILYQNVYFEMLSETYYYTSEFSDDDCIQISEKTIKPIVNLIPHFCLSKKNYYEYLKKLGLSFESKIFQDVTLYDNIQTSSEKVNTFFEKNKKFLSMNKKDLHEMYVDSYDELKHNQHTIIEKFNGNYINNTIRGII